MLLYGALRAICGIGQAVENKQMKDYSYKIDEKGRPTRNHLVIQIKENQPI